MTHMFSKLRGAVGAVLRGAAGLLHGGAESSREGTRSVAGNRKSVSRVVAGALVLGVGLSLAGCATFSSVGGTADAHGLFSSAKVASSGSEVVGSYGIILGLIDSGYEGYVAAVQAAEAAGKVVSTVTTQYLGFYTKVTAYAK